MYNQTTFISGFVAAFLLGAITFHSTPTESKISIPNFKPASLIIKIDPLEEIEPDEEYQHPILSEDEINDIVENDEELYCMALNIYHEARGDTKSGKFAVADVVLNRVESKRFPNTVCDVVHQARYDSNGNPIKYKCQFSWYCDGKSDVPHEEKAWKRSAFVAYEIMELGKFRGITDGSDHYHVHDMEEYPYWHDSFVEKGIIGSHAYYSSK